MKYWVGFLALGLLTSCARDRDADDEKKDKLHEDLAKLESITGSYAGSLKANRTNNDLGLVGISLEADTAINGFNEEIPVLKVTLLFQSSSVIKFTFRNSSFDADDNSFKTISTPKELMLSGKIVDGKLLAKIETFAYSELGAHMELERVVSAQSFEDAFAEPLPSNEATLGSLTKTYLGKNDGRQMKLILSNDNYLPEDRFGNYFDNLQVLDVVFTHDLPSNLSVTFKSAIWDKRNRLLKAQQDRPGMDPFQLTMECRVAGMTAENLEKLACTYKSTLTGLNAKYQFTQVR